jgi:hypothetical protein
MRSCGGRPPTICNNWNTHTYIHTTHYSNKTYDEYACVESTYTVHLCICVKHDCPGTCGSCSDTGGARSTSLKRICTGSFGFTPGSPDPSTGAAVASKSPSMTPLVRSCTKSGVLGRMLRSASPCIAHRSCHVMSRTQHAHRDGMHRYSSHAYHGATRKPKRPSARSQQRRTYRTNKQP